jgi:hypothetical protein
VIARTRVIATAVLLTLAVGALWAAVSSGQRTYTLPDLRQVVPGEVGLKVVNGRDRLVFSSTIVNVGNGPFVVVGHRPSTRRSYMTGDQVLFDAAGHSTKILNIGQLLYIRAPDHAHWHLQKLEIYELRDAATGKIVAPDRKTGFCPGDRYVVQSGMPRGWNRRLGQLRNDLYCGKKQTKALTVLESISPGWADVYKPNLEGQYIDVTGVPAGEYVLVNRVNSRMRMREAGYDNNASSALIRINRPAGGPPSVEKLDSCQDSAVCPKP